MLFREAANFLFPRPYSFNPNSEVATANLMGSTGHWPVPSGDPPFGMGKAHELFRTAVGDMGGQPVPSGQWPDGTGGSPVLPIPASEFGFNSEVGKAGGVTGARRAERIYAAQYLMALSSEHGGAEGVAMREGTGAQGAPI